jgi:DNA-binding ferritin-like protein (Dps family)
MSISARTTLTAIALAASLTAAQAQTSHDAHHPPGAPAAIPGARTPPGQASGTPGSGMMGAGGQPGGAPAMMGDEMGRMMRMMSEMTGAMGSSDEADDASRMGQLMQSMSRMMATMGGMMEERGAGEPAEALPVAPVERRIAFLKAQLQITDAQEPQWTAFTDALRAGPQNIRSAYAAALKDGPPANAADRADLRVKLLSSMLDALKTTASAERALYAVLTDDQKQVADQLLSGPVGRP